MRSIQVFRVVNSIVIEFTSMDNISEMRKLPDGIYIATRNRNINTLILRYMRNGLPRFWILNTGASSMFFDDIASSDLNIFANTKDSLTSYTQQVKQLLE